MNSPFSSGPSGHFFYGFEGNGLFKIYVDEMAFHGGKVGNHIYNEQTARATFAHLGLLGLLLSRGAAKKAIAKRTALEAQYDALAPGSPPFRETDKANFTLSGSDVLSATLKPKPTGIKGAFSSGAQLELALASGKKRKFILVEDQDVEVVKNLVSKVVPNTQMQV